MLKGLISYFAERHFLTNLIFVLVLVGGGFVVFYFAMVFYVRWYITWENENRKGMNYYGKTLKERRRFRAQIKRNSFFMPVPMAVEKVFRILTKKMPPIPSKEFGGMTIPSYSCTPESVEKAKAYQPGDKDIFVATQMKCGTTWMQQIVFEILNRGKGDLSDSGFGHLNAVSPWLEATDGVPVEKAPAVGEKKRRIIKTHLPASYCYSPNAKYIYVARHPASCFASILDYFKLMSGSIAPPKENLLEWFCSEKMWFTPWPDHVSGWWKKSTEADNVLFLRYEDLKMDLRANVSKVARFLEMDLTESELTAVEKKCGFDYMKAHQEFFEMSPPNFCAVKSHYFVDGSLHRHKAVPPDIRKKIEDYCRGRMDKQSEVLLNPYQIQ